MASVNKVILIGNLGRDPEVRYMPNGDCIANLSVGTTDKWKDKNTGEPREQTEWHRVVISGKSAEYVNMYGKKGSQVYIEGALRTRKWTDKEGIERYTTEVRFIDVQLLGGRPAGNGADNGNQRPAGNGNQRPAGNGNQRPAGSADRSGGEQYSGADGGLRDQDYPF